MQADSANAANPANPDGRSDERPGQWDARPVMAGTAAIAAQHQAAAEAGVSVLAQGGNAIDAAVAGVLAAAVADVGRTGIGGYGGHLVFHKRSAVARFRKLAALGVAWASCGIPNAHEEGSLELIGREVVPALAAL